MIADSMSEEGLLSGFIDDVFVVSPHIWWKRQGTNSVFFYKGINPVHEGSAFET